MYKRITALLLCMAMLLSLVPMVGAEEAAPVAEAVSNNASIQLLTDSYKAGSGSFTLTADSRFYFVSDAEPNETTKELLQFISQQFALDKLPSAQTLPIRYGEEKYAQTGDVILKLDMAAAGGVAEGYCRRKLLGEPCGELANQHGQNRACEVDTYMQGNGVAEPSGFCVYVAENESHESGVEELIEVAVEKSEKHGAYKDRRPLSVGGESVHHKLSEE